MPYPPQATAPVRPARPAVRVVAGLLWAFAAVLAVGAQYADIYSRRITWSPNTQDHAVVGLWQSRFITSQQEVSTPAFDGVPVLVAIAVLAVASLLVFVTRRRWGAVAVGALGAGMILDQAASYVTIAVTDEAFAGLRPGWWLIIGAATVAIAGFAVALTERAGEPAGPYPTAAPFPQPQPHWPHQAPTYGPPAPSGPPPTPPSE
jgi:hypothetical protein